MNNILRNNEKGLSLVEVLASVVILGIAVVIFMQISDYQFGSVKQSELSQQAMRIADNTLNTLRSDIHNLTPNAHFPIDQNPFSCTRSSSVPACQQLPERFELTIHHIHYHTQQTIEYPPADNNSQATSSAIIYINQVPTLFTVTVKWR